MEDEDNNIHLKNLSIHPANNEEEALNLLFLGDTNRMIAEVILCRINKLKLIRNENILNSFLDSYESSIYSITLYFHFAYNS